MESYDPMEMHIMTQEQGESMRREARRNTFSQVKSLSWYFAAAFFLESVLLYIIQSVFFTFWNTLDMMEIYDRVALWEMADETFAILYYLTAFLLPYLLFAKLAGFRLRDIPHGRPYPPVVLASTGVSMGVSLAGSFMTVTVLTFFANLGLNPPAYPPYPSYPLAMGLNLFNTLVLPPLIEELVYRGILLGSLRRFGDSIAVVISALIFGLAHGNMAQMPYSFVLGLMMGFFVIKTHSIYTSIFIHFVNNALATFIDLFEMNLSTVAANITDSIVTLLYVIFFIIGMLYLVVVRKADWKLRGGNTGIPGGVIARRFFFTLPMVLVLVVMGFQILASFTP